MAIRKGHMFDGTFGMRGVGYEYRWRGVTYRLMLRVKFRLSSPLFRLQFTTMRFKDYTYHSKESKVEIVERSLTLHSRLIARRFSPSEIERRKRVYPDLHETIGYGDGS